MADPITRPASIVHGLTLESGDPPHNSVDPVANQDKSLQADAILLPWLLHQGSLTKKLKRTTGSARLEVLTHQWCQADLWDQQRLRLPSDRAIHREILMWSDCNACWYARTIISELCYQTEPAFFEQLRTRSLGRLIFNEPLVVRVNLVYYAIQQDATEYHWLPSHLSEEVEPLWLRCSTFKFKTNELFYLYEIFLPGLVRSIR